MTSSTIDFECVSFDEAERQAVVATLLAIIPLRDYSLPYRIQLLLRPLKVLLHSCPACRRLFLEISATSVGVEKRKLLLHHAN